MARKSSRKRSRSGWLPWIVRMIFRFVLAFLILSLFFVILFRFVPPPFTLTMVGDVVSGRSVTKDWMPLSQMDPDMARAAIAAEDGNFCRHNGFDFNAIQKALAGN